MSHQTPHTKNIDEYIPIVGREKIEEIKDIAATLQHEHIVMVNSTPAGGGVAEILNSLVIILNNLGVLTGWRILKGSDSFFSVTKEFHNALQGGQIKLTKRIMEIYEQANYNNSLMNHLDSHDLVVIHDPQPLPLIQYYKKRIPWIWRFHPDLTEPNKELFKYLKGFIRQYDAMIISSPEYKQTGMGIKQIIMHPSIDPLSEKNRDMPLKEIRQILAKHNIKTNKPIISQVSRFDKWKDPIGVIDVFEKVQKKADCHLVLMGNMALDDPEGPAIYREVVKRTKHADDITVLMNVADNDRTVNALQRTADVILQKSIREGFALTVSEALWKETPVVGTRVGGIPLQVKHGKTGYLVETNQQAANAIVKLLQNNKLKKRLGKQGKEYVKEHFLITRHVLDYLKLFQFYLGRQHKFNIGKKYPYGEV